MADSRSQAVSADISSHELHQRKEKRRRYTRKAQMALMTVKKVTWFISEFKDSADYQDQYTGDTKCRYEV